VATLAFLSIRTARNADQAAHDLCWRSCRRLVATLAFLWIRTARNADQVSASTKVGGWIEANRRDIRSSPALVWPVVRC